MAYKEVFIYSYSILLAVMFMFLFVRLLRMSRRLVLAGAGQSRATTFFLGRLPATVIVWLWSSFLFGSALGAAWSATLWLIT